MKLENNKSCLPEVVGVPPECDFELLEELVHPREQRLRRAGLGGDGGGALEHDHAVREVRGHDEVVLNDEPGLLGVEDEALDHLGSKG